MAQPPERIQTERLLLRCFAPDDAPQLKSTIDANLEHLRRWLPWAMNEPSPLEAVRAKLERFRRDFFSGGEWIFAVFDRGQRELLGVMGVHRRHGPDSLEIGYWLRADAQGHGFATEAARALVPVAFALGAAAVEIRCDPNNARSAAVPRRLGLPLAATIPNETTTPAGQPRDTLVFRVTAGLAEIAAGSIAMGLGGFLAARSDAEHYASERNREQSEMREKAHLEFAEVKGILESYGLAPEESEKVTRALERRPEAMVDFMMRFELGLERPEPGGAWKSALTIGASYVVGGLVPLLPYFFLDDARRGLPISAGTTLATLLVFGFVKGRFTGALPWKSALQTCGIGSLAAGVAFCIARLVAG